MKIGALASSLKKSLLETVKIFSGMGLQGVQIGMNLEWLEYSDEKIAEVRNLCAENGLEISAIRAMNDGFHELCEKPMARTVRLADDMIRVSEKTGRLLMIAQCLRFDPVYCEIKKLFESGKYGKLLRFDMRRLSAAPNGPASWYRKAELSGGALFDLHLHNTDFIQYLLGMPESVQTFGVSRVSGGIDDLITNYNYPDGPLVSAESSWCRAKWTCSTVAVFEKATVEITGGNTLSVYQADKPVRELSVKGRNGYWNEIRYFAECIRKERKPEIASVESTRESIRLVLCEEKSALCGRQIRL